MRLDLKYKTMFEKYGVNTPLRKAHFMAQIEHESNLKPVSENLNYSVKTLIKVFKRKFDRNKDGFLDENEKLKIKEIIGSQEKIANFIYANVNGNGGESSGDGWKYRGRGFIQCTARNNYKEFSKYSNIDCLLNPDLLLREDNAILCALWFWNSRGLNKYADADNILLITKKINGGINGLEHREQLLLKWKKIFKI